MNDFSMGGGIGSTIARLVQSMSISVGEVGKARSLPPELYTSQEFFEFEKDAVFFRTWLALGHQNQIPNPGDFFTVEIVDEPLIVVRQRDRSIKVLSATCQHRGHPLLRDCGAEQTGTRSSFTCPYHAWTYGITGELAGAPEMAQTVPLAEQRADTRLPELRVELFHGFIFANFDPNAKPLASTLRKADRELANYDFPNMKVMPTQVYRNNPWNWKITLENGLEPYHTDYVHRGLHERAPGKNAEFTDWNDWQPGENYVTHLTWFLDRKMDTALNPTGKAFFPPLKNLTETERSRVVFSAVPPTLFFCLLVDQAFTFRVFPRSADSFDLLLNFYYPVETVQMPDFEGIRRLQLAATGAFGEQDDLTNTTMQKAFKSRFAPRGRYSHLESILPQFNRWLLEKYTAHIG